MATPMIQLIEGIAPEQVLLATTSREGGFSKPPYNNFNLGDHVGDDLALVTANRQLLYSSLNINGQIQWLEQIHGSDVVNVIAHQPVPPRADAAYTKQKGMALAILTADCLPILLSNKLGTEIAAIHAGWRPLAADILTATIDKFDCPANEIIAWLGPCIGPDAFEVGPEVKAQFLSLNSKLNSAFNATNNGKYLANLHVLATRLLQVKGITTIHAMPECTHSNTQKYFSYRRDGQTGRMASVIAIKP